MILCCERSYHLVWSSGHLVNDKTWVWASNQARLAEPPQPGISSCFFSPPSFIHLTTPSMYIIFFGMICLPPPGCKPRLVICSCISYRCIVFKVLFVGFFIGMTCFFIRMINFFMRRRTVSLRRISCA